MKVVCKKIFSSVTGEDLGLEKHSLKVGDDYVVLMMSYSKHKGVYIAFETNDYFTAMFPLKGFEFVSDYNILSSWVKDIEYGSDGAKYICKASPPSK